MMPTLIHTESVDKENARDMGELCSRVEFTLVATFFSIIHSIFGFNPLQYFLYVALIV